MGNKERAQEWKRFAEMDLDAEKYLKGRESRYRTFKPI
ncbi:hypothetical protein Mahau_1561 [Mahella australiensis 50-1 BON]|uniref:Uncharacterized protein n=1 Tax=Mahella australiensis (strain DSM 15567 / CIP 107919 / 50-1 BON) TaxID=697281 RepID=F3ZYZ1_MAHA5|nr:hypothetical protein Mahau_1561 [Mahella australiensis 50-1 BON]